MSDMLQRCPYGAVTALLLHDLKQEMLAAWPLNHQADAGSGQASAAALPLTAKGPFVTFGVSLLLDTVPATCAPAASMPSTPPSRAFLPSYAGAEALETPPASRPCLSTCSLLRLLSARPACGFWMMHHHLLSDR